MTGDDPNHPPLPVEQLIAEMQGLANSRMFTASSRAVFARVVVLLEEVAPKVVQRHIGRGSYYEVMRRAAEVQCAAPIVEGDRVTVYRDGEGGWWVRPDEEFSDGRFELIEPNR